MLPLSIIGNRRGKAPDLGMQAGEARLHPQIWYLSRQIL